MRTEIPGLEMYTTGKRSRARGCTVPSVHLISTISCSAAVAAVTSKRRARPREERSRVEAPSWSNLTSVKTFSSYKIAGHDRFQNLSVDQHIFLAAPMFALPCFHCTVSMKLHVLTKRSFPYVISGLAIVLHDN